MAFEKPTKYYMALAKSNYLNKTMKKVTTPTETITDQNGILEAIREYYADLFSNKDHLLNSNLIDTTLDTVAIPKLSATQKFTLNKEFNLTELSKALHKMKNNKTPGTDGFPADFYKVFWNKLKHIIMRAFQEFYRQGKMSITARTGILTCLPKGNKPRDLLKNWRPLTMLSVPYKLISSTLASRIKPIIKDLIPPTQTGFVDGRFIGDTTRLIYDLIDVTNNKNITGLLMLIDFEKAFDSISWNFMLKVLKKFQFGETFINWIGILNNDVVSSILQYGHFSKNFKIKRG